MTDEMRITEAALFETIGRLTTANQMLQQRLGKALEELGQLSQLVLRVETLTDERDDLKRRLAALTAAIEASRQRANGHDEPATVGVVTRDDIDNGPVGA